MQDLLVLHLLNELCSKLFVYFSLSRSFVFSNFTFLHFLAILKLHQVKIFVKEGNVCLFDLRDSI